MHRSRLQQSMSVGFVALIPKRMPIRRDQPRPNLLFRPLFPFFSGLHPGRMSPGRPSRRSQRLLARPPDPSVSTSPTGSPSTKRRRTAIAKASSRSRRVSSSVNSEYDGSTFSKASLPSAPQTAEQNEAPPNSTTPLLTQNAGNHEKSVAGASDIYPVHHSDMPFEKSKCGPSALRLVTWNVVSIRSIMRSEALQKYVLLERPHILCVQETKLSAATEEQFDGLPGYNVYWYHSERKGYSGVAAFVREDGPDLERVTRGIGDTTADAEGRVLTLLLASGLRIVVAYVPNAGGKLERLPYRTETFEPAMRKYLAEQAALGSVVYCGDLNVAHEEIDIHNSKGNVKSAGHTPQEREQFGILLQHSPTWVDCYRDLYPSHPGYTYYSRRFGTRLKEQGKGWRLDYFLLDRATYNKNPVIDCFVRPQINGSDHYPLVIDLDLSRLSTDY